MVDALGQLGILHCKDVAVEVAVLFLRFEGSEVGCLLSGVSECGGGVGAGGGELGALCQLVCRGFFGGRITDFAGEHFAVLAEEIHVGVATDLATHGLNKSHWFYLRPNNVGVVPTPTDRTSC